MVWWEGAHTAPPQWTGNHGGVRVRQGRPFQGIYHAARRSAGWQGHLFHLGRNKEIFDTEVYAIYRTLGIVDERE